MSAADGPIEGLGRSRYLVRKDNSFYLTGKRLKLADDLDRWRKMDRWANVWRLAGREPIDRLPSHCGDAGHGQRGG
jgi:hypothetical protein